MSIKYEKKYGICKLTQLKGLFVKSHIIPQAFTKPAVLGFPFVQLRSGGHPIKRWSSWYDSRLVTEDGERILSDYDNWAISEFRRLKLVWSSWEGKKLLTEVDPLIGNNIFSVREIKGFDYRKMRLFILSLLWRAASTELKEFAEIQLPKESLEQMRVMVLNGCVDPIDFYPASILQLSTIGEIHNQTPIAQVKKIPSLLEGDSDIEMPIFRFYFDGLIIHIHCHSSDDGYTASLGKCIVGAAERLVLPVRSYSGSFQEENLNNIIANM